jgi:hypothetical protein
MVAIATSEGKPNSPSPRNNRVAVWNLSSLKRIGHFEGDRDIIEIVWQSGGEIVTKSSSNQILWAREGDQWIQQESSQITTISKDEREPALSPDGRWEAKDRNSSTIEITDTRSSESMGRIALPKYSRIKSRIKDIQWNPLGDRISVVTGASQTAKYDRIHLLNPQRGTKLKTINPGFEKILVLSWNPAGTMIATASYQNLIIWDSKRGSELGRFSLEEGHESALIKSPYVIDGDTLIFQSDHHTLPRRVLHWGTDGRHLYYVSTRTLHRFDLASVTSSKYIIPPPEGAGYEGSEKQLEDMIEQQPEVLGFGYRILGRQVQAADGRIDLLMQGPDGAIVVVELKKDEADDMTVGQILRYLSWTDLNHPSELAPRGIIVAKDFSENLRLAVRGSSYHIQLIPTSMIFENYRRGE